MPLTRRGIEVLVAMAGAEDRGEYEDAEIVCSGFECWLGLERVSRRTVTNLLRHACVSDQSDGGLAERYVLTGTGRASIHDPECAERVLQAVMEGRNVDERGFPVS